MKTRRPLTSDESALVGLTEKIWPHVAEMRKIVDRLPTGPEKTVINQHVTVLETSVQMLNVGIKEVHTRVE